MAQLCSQLRRATAHHRRRPSERFTPNCYLLPHHCQAHIGRKATSTVTSTPFHTMRMRCGTVFHGSLMTTMEHVRLSEGEKIVFHEEQHCSTPQATCSTRAHGVEHCCSSLWNIAFHTTYHLWNIHHNSCWAHCPLSPLNHSITNVEHTTFDVEQGQMHVEHLLAHVWNTLWDTSGTLSLFSRV